MRPSLRFHSPLIEPDVRISRIRLSDWLHLEAHDGRLPWSLRSRTTPSSPKMVASAKHLGKETGYVHPFGLRTGDAGPTGQSYATTLRRGGAIRVYPEFSGCSASLVPSVDGVTSGEYYFCTNVMEARHGIGDNRKRAGNNS